MILHPVFVCEIILKSLVINNITGHKKDEYPTIESYVCITDKSGSDITKLFLELAKGF